VKSDSTKADKKRSRILIVDDHPLVCQGLGQMIEDEPGLELSGLANEASEAMRLIEQTNPHLVVVDISLKDSNGLELIKQIKARHPEVKMLVSSMHDESLYAERALRAGAMGYINKQEAPDKVIQGFRQVLSGQVYLSARMADRILHRVVEGEEELNRSPIDTLSDRELEVFELIGKGMTTRQIAKRLHLSPKTIETHREHIKFKLNLKNINELVRHAVKWQLEKD
jgi:DNA-binding NarL/FixJ family response regulator